MGNGRFKISDMMPNAWFYKLKDMGRSRNHKKKQPTMSATAPQPSGPKHPHHQNYLRKSYYFSREVIPTCHDRSFRISSPADATFTDCPPDPPRRSYRQRVRRRSSRSSPKLVISADCSCSKTDAPTDYSGSAFDDSPADYSFPPEFRSDQVLPTEAFYENVSWSSRGCCKVDSDPNDIVITVDKESLVNKLDKLYVFDKVPDLDLPPIITKAVKFDDEVVDIKRQLERNEPTKHRRNSTKNKERNGRQSLSVKVVKQQGVTGKEQKTSSVPRHSVTSPGVRLRVNSPRIASRRIQNHGRKSQSSLSNSRSQRSLPDSFAIVKSSFDPQRDFRDSMVEMIVENNIKASKDLEDLLACYLSLNSDEYHDLIIKVFRQIWFESHRHPVK